MRRVIYWKDLRSSIHYRSGFRKNLLEERVALPRREVEKGGGHVEYDVCS